jgi:hypothetical protein
VTQEYLRALSEALAREEPPMEGRKLWVPELGVYLTDDGIYDADWNRIEEKE